MKTFRVGQTLHPGRLLVDSPGFGVLGSAIPVDGYLYPYLTLPADLTAEMRGEVLTWPGAGTLTVNKDTSWSFSGPDGAYEFTFQAYRDNVPFGPVRTVSFTVGDVVDVFSYTGSGGVSVGGTAAAVFVANGARTFSYVGEGGVSVGGTAASARGRFSGAGGGRRGGGDGETLVERLLRENQKEPVSTTKVIRTYHSAGGGAKVGGSARTALVSKPQTRAVESTGGAVAGGAAVVQFKPRIDPQVRRARRNAVLIMAAAARNRG